MPRKARKQSNSGIYHVVIRGIDKRNIFLDDADRRFFLNCLMTMKIKCDFHLYAYCLMDNHVHLIIKESERISVTIKRISISYAYMHNQKYGRTGHLFENRFKSHCIEDNAYLLNAIRYVHQNPVRAGIVTLIANYKWSSYRAYIEKNPSYVHVHENAHSKQAPPLIDTHELLGRLSLTTTGYITRMKEHLDEMKWESDADKRPNDETIRNELCQHFDLDKINNATTTLRNALIRQMIEHSGASHRQLSRILGISAKIIFGALHPIIKKVK